MKNSQMEISQQDGLLLLMQIVIIRVGLFLRMPLVLIFQYHFLMDIILQRMMMRVVVAVMVAVICYTRIPLLCQRDKWSYLLIDISQQDLVKLFISMYLLIIGLHTTKCILSIMVTGMKNGLEKLLIYINILDRLLRLHSTPMIMVTGLQV